MFAIIIIDGNINIKIIFKVINIKIIKGFLKNNIFIIS